MRATGAAEGEQDKEEKQPTKEKKRGPDHEVSLSGEDDYEYTYTSYETETETDSTAEIARRIAKEDQRRAQGHKGAAKEARGTCTFKNHQSG